MYADNGERFLQYRFERDSKQSIFNCNKIVLYQSTFLFDRQNFNDENWKNYVYNVKMMQGVPIVQTKLYISTALDQKTRQTINQYITSAKTQSGAKEKDISSLKDIFLHDSLWLDEDVQHIQLQPDNINNNFLNDGTTFEQLLFYASFSVASFLIIASNSAEIKNDQHKELDCDDRIELMKIQLRMKKKIKTTDETDQDYEEEARE